MLTAVAGMLVLGAVGLGAAPAQWQLYNGSVISGCCQPGMNSTDGAVLYAGKTSTETECEAKCDENAACTQGISRGSKCGNACVDSIEATGPPCCPTPPPGSTYTANWCSLTKHRNPQWFADAKFGIYAHWGLYSVPAFGSEWYSRNMYVNGSSVNKHHIETYGKDFGYKDFIPMFTAPHFNATEWASIYRRAGARYAGPVAEHADGFAMFKSNVSHYNAAEMGPKRDITGELDAAIRAQGLRLVTTMHHEWLWAWYPTWDNYTDAGNPKYELTETQGGLYGPPVSSASCFSGTACPTTPRFNDYFVAKVKEVVDQYHPDVLYFDSKQSIMTEDARLDYLSHYYNAAVNWMKSGTSAGVVCTYKNTDLAEGAGVIDFERGGINYIRAEKWQTDDALGRGSWSWVDPPNLKNETEIIGELVDIVSKGGNLLLDIPPHADGSIDPAVRHTLYAIGDWLEINGAAIFATTPWIDGDFGEGPTRLTPGSFHEWPIFTPKDFRFTTTGSTLFVIAMAWSDDNMFTVSYVNSTSPLGKRVTALSLLGSSEVVKYSITKAGLRIGPISKPAKVEHAFAFRLHLDGSNIGFLSWDLPHPKTPVVVPGELFHLRWFSGGNSEELVALDMWTGSRWEAVADDVPNTGAYRWAVPASIPAGPPTLRIRSKSEPLVQHTTAFSTKR